MKEFNFVGVENIKASIKSEKRRFKRYLDKYQDYATQYAFDVLFTDKYETGRDEQLACFRHLQDLGRQKTSDFPYEYNLDYVNAIEYFARNIPDPTDMDVLITPFEFESFCIDSLIGWRNVKTKGTRFHMAYISFARQQGKTWIAAILINFYYFVVGWDATAQDFLIASYDSDHAGKLFDYVSLQAKVICQLPEFKAGTKKRGVDVQNRQVIGHNNRSTIRMGSSQAGGFDSKHNLIAVYDEFGNMKPKYNESINQIISGQNFPNALFVAISTAYPDVKVKFKKDQDSIRNLIEQDSNREGDETFAVIYRQDSEEEVYQPETWEKSNPLLRSPKLHDKWLEHLISLRDEQERAGDLASFANKTMNLWSKKFQNSFLSLENIQKNVIDSFDIKNRDVYIGFDASQFNDNTSFGFEYPYIDQPKKHTFHFEQFSFIPFSQAKTIQSKEKQDGLPYRELEKRGICQITDNPNGIIDKNQVYRWFEEFVIENNLKIKGILLDPNLAEWFVKKLENDHPDWPIMTVRPTSQVLSNPTKDLQNQFINGSVTILDDPMLIDGLNNAVLVEDRGGAVKVDRLNRTSEHIDTTDAIINAHYSCQYYFENFKEENYNPINDMNSEEKRDYFKGMFG